MRRWITVEQAYLAKTIVFDAEKVCEIILTKRKEPIYNGDYASSEHKAGLWFLVTATTSEIGVYYFWFKTEIEAKILMEKIQL